MRHILGDKRKGLSADGRTGDQTQGDAAKRGGVVHPRHCLERRTQRVQVALLAGLVTGSSVQDVPAVEDQNKHVDLRGLQALLGRSILKRRERKKEVNTDRKRFSLVETVLGCD